MNPGVLVESIEGRRGCRLRSQLPGLVPPDSPLSCWMTFILKAFLHFSPAAATTLCLNTFLRTVFSLESHEAGCPGAIQFEELSWGQKTRYFHRTYPHSL